MIKNITYSKSVTYGIKANHRSTPLDSNLRLFGADTETYKGLPHTIQCYNGQDMLFKYVSSRDIFDVFSVWVLDRCREKGSNIVYFHKLNFDIPIIFFKWRRQIYEQISEINFQAGKFKVNMIFGKINYVKMTYKDVKIDIFDSLAFTQNSLKNSLSMFKIQAEKLLMPKGLGSKRLKTKEFEDYAKNDAIAQYKLAQKIMEYHSKYNIKPSISLPQFSARVLRHHFFKRDETIFFPPEPIARASELSYHGGKNGYYGN